MKKIILIIITLLAVFAQVACTETKAEEQIDISVDMYQIGVWDANAKVIFHKSVVDDVISNDSIKIEKKKTHNGTKFVSGQKFTKSESLQIKAYFTASKLRGEFIVFSSKKGLSIESENAILKKFNITSYYIFVDEE
jgi:hypothetical protein